MFERSDILLKKALLWCLDAIYVILGILALPFRFAAWPWNRGLGYGVGKVFTALGYLAGGIMFLRERECPYTNAFLLAMVCFLYLVITFVVSMAVAALMSLFGIMTIEPVVEFLYLWAVCHLGSLGLTAIVVFIKRLPRLREDLRRSLEEEQPEPEEIDEGPRASNNHLGPRE